VRLKVSDAAAGATWSVERDRRVADLNAGVVWSRVEASAADHRTTKTGADRDVEEIMDATPSTERTLAEDRHLRVVLKERGEVERRADRPSEIRARKVGAEVGGLSGDPAPRINGAWCADTNTNKSCDCGCVFDACRISCLLQRADACGNDGGWTAAHGSCACSAADTRAVSTHDRCANLRPAEIEGEEEADSQAQVAMDQSLVEALQAALAAMQQDPQQFFEPVKRLALHIAEQLVLGELRLDGSAIDRLVQRCVDDLAANEASMVLVELHPDDLHALHDLRKRAGLVEKNLPQLVVNEDLPPGSVRASANDALVEDLVTHRLAAIARVLNMDAERVRAQSAFHPERMAAERSASTAAQDVPVRMGSTAPARATDSEVIDVENSDV
jgi:hypothetical protein